MTEPYVCPATFSGSLDNFLRRMIHKPEKILTPYVKEGMTALDMGCGPGYFTPALAALVGGTGKVIAADLQYEMLDKMLQKLTRLGLEKRVEAQKCQPDKTGIVKKVDFILIFWMVHEVPDQQRFLEEMKSLLNPGGRIFIAEPIIHVTGSDFTSMITRLESAGLQVTERPKISISRSVLAELKMH